MRTEGLHIDFFEETGIDGVSALGIGNYKDRYVHWLEAKVLSQKTPNNRPNEAIEAIKSALRIDWIWMPGPEVKEEHADEAKALHAMREDFLRIVQRPHSA